MEKRFKNKADYINSKQSKLKKQSELQDRIVGEAGVNLVNCGNCGSVMLHEVKSITDENLHEDHDLECPFCDFKSDPCDFPDYFYEGFELSGEFSFNQD